MSLKYYDKYIPIATAIPYLVLFLAKGLIRRDDVTATVADVVDTPFRLVEE